MQQLIMNLVINGAEAISEDQSGTVLVTTALQDVMRSRLVYPIADRRALR